MNFKKLKELWWHIEYKISELTERQLIAKMKKKYPDYDEMYDIGSLHHVWGVKSYDDLSGKDCNIWTMNDIEILYDREDKKYSLSIETAFMFKDRHTGECEYLTRLLKAFEGYMDASGRSKEYDYCLFMKHWELNSRCDTIEELYFNFRVYVLGICATRGYKVGQ